LFRTLERKFRTRDRKNRAVDRKSRTREWLNRTSDQPIRTQYRASGRRGQFLQRALAQSHCLHAVSAPPEHEAVREAHRRRQPFAWLCACR
jgi:predicted aminopeptidase